MKPRFVQIKNPKTKCYNLIDRDRGIIMAYSKADRPFHGILRVNEKGKPELDLREDIEIFKFYKGLFFTDDEIKNSLYQQVMSIFRPKRFPVFKDEAWLKFVPITQLEKIVYKNLKEHRPEPMAVPDKFGSPPLFSGAKSLSFKREESCQ